MARVVVIGAGIAGLVAAIHAVSDGHHVVVLERKSKIGGRGTSQNIDGFSLHFGFWTCSLPILKPLQLLGSP